MKSSLLVGVLATEAAAQSGAWAPCGGIGFSGSTSCASGYTCVYSNDWYSQCVPGSAATTLKTTTASAPTRTSTPSKGKFKWFGINQSCGEFGKGVYPGIWGKEFTSPSTSSIQTHINDGFNAFRVAFAMERLVPGQLTGSVNYAYLQNLTAVVNFITNLVSSAR